MTVASNISLGHESNRKLLARSVKDLSPAQKAPVRRVSRPATEGRPRRQAPAMAAQLTKGKKDYAGYYDIN